MTLQYFFNGPIRKSRKSKNAEIAENGVKSDHFDIQNIKTSSFSTFLLEILYTHTAAVLFHIYSVKKWGGGNVIDG